MSAPADQLAVQQFMHYSCLKQGCERGKQYWMSETVALRRASGVGFPMLVAVTNSAVMRSIMPRLTDCHK